MNWYLFITAFAMFLGGLFSIATSSIAIECYNKNEQTKKEKESNFSFLISNLVCAIILVIIACTSIYFAFKPSDTVVSAGQKAGLDQFVLSKELLNKAAQENKEAAIAEYAAAQSKLNAQQKLQTALASNPELIQALKTVI